MSTTRPYSPGDRGPEPSGASGTPGGGAPATSAPDGGVPAPSGPSASAGSSGGGQVRRLSFDDQGGVVPLARDFTRQALYAWGWLPAATADQRAAAEDVLLVVSELVTNALVHTGGQVRLDLALVNGRLRLAVADASPRTPVKPTSIGWEATGGRGILLVEALSAAWGTLPVSGGKQVWAEFVLRR